MLAVAYILSYRQNGRPSLRRLMSIHGAADFIFGKFCLQWIKDDWPFFPLKNKNPIRWIANSRFVVENLVMILLFFFSGHSNTWYALSVTVFVCSFTVLGGIMRITHYYVLGEQHIETRNIHVDPQLQKTSFHQLIFILFTTTRQQYDCHARHTVSLSRKVQAKDQNRTYRLWLDKDKSSYLLIWLNICWDHGSSYHKPRCYSRFSPVTSSKL